MPELTYGHSGNVSGFIFCRDENLIKIFKCCELQKGSLLSQVMRSAARRYPRLQLQVERGMVVSELLHSWVQLLEASRHSFVSDIKHRNQQMSAYAFTDTQCMYS